MRASTWLGMLIVGFAVVVVIPAMTTGQPGGFGKKGGGGGGFPGGGGGFPGGGGGGFPGGGGGGMQQDPNAMFEYLSKNRGYFLISETRMLNGPLTQYAQEKGITNGQISRQQYLEFNDWRQKQAAAGGGFGTKGFGKKGGGMEMAAPQGGGNTGPTPEQISAAAEFEFKRRDRNQDGNLIREEMPDSLRGSVEQYDKNGDAMINLNEFKDYFAARAQNGGQDQGNRNVASIIIQEEDLDAKPVVYRAGGKMPTGLPKWFMDLDTDQDGQIGLYEWRRANKSFDDFATWDINSDGFITPDEALRQQAVLTKNSKNGSMAFGGDEGGEGEGKRKFGEFFGKGDGGKGKGKGGFPFGGGGERPPFGGGGTGERPAFGTPFGGGGGGFPRIPDSGSSDGGGSKKKKKGGN